MRRLPLALLALGLVTAGCSSEEDKQRDAAIKQAKTYAATGTDQIWADVLASYQSLSSLHMRGSTMEGDSTVTVDISLDTDGRCRGTMQLGAGTFQLLSDGRQLWMKGDATAWDDMAGEGTGDVFADKWVTGLGDGGVQEICDLTGLVDQMNAQFGTEQSHDDNLPGDTVVGTALVDGLAAVTLQSTDSADLTPITVQVAATEPHYLLQMISATLGDMAFTDQNQPVDVTPPAVADVMDLSTQG